MARSIECRVSGRVGDRGRRRVLQGRVCVNPGRAMAGGRTRIGVSGCARTRIVDDGAAAHRGRRVATGRGGRAAVVYDAALACGGIRTVAGAHAGAADVGAAAERSALVAENVAVRVAAGANRCATTGTDLT